MFTKSSIAIIDDCDSFLRLAKRRLERAGYKNLYLIETYKEFVTSYEVEFDLLLVDIYLSGICGIDIIRDARNAGYQGLIATISVDYTIEAVNQSVWAGSDDFIIKNNRLDLAQEVSRLLMTRNRPRNERSPNLTLPESSFLRGIGLSNFENTVVSRFYPSFPSQKELAFLLNKSEGYIRKTFSSIYSKFSIDSNAQLACMLTLCSRFCRC